MAIAINQNPLTHTPATNPVLFVFTRDQTAQPNFSYKVELFINSALFGTYELYPMFGTYCKFDASEYVRSFVSTHLEYLSGFSWVSVDQAVDMYIVVHESYGTPPALEDSATSAGNYVFNGSLRYNDFIAFNDNNYWLDYTNGTSPTFMSSYPIDQRQITPYGAPFFVGILVNRDHEYYELKLNIFDITGTMTYSYINVIDLDFIVNMLDISPRSMDSNGWTTGSEWDTCYYYEVQLIATYDSIPYTTQYTLPIRLYLDQSCYRFEQQRLYWVNKFGIVEQFDFNMYSEESTSINSYGYQVQPGDWIEGFYNLSLMDTEKKINMKTAEDRITLNTDWIKPAVQNWLVRELYESPQAWIWNKSTGFQPVIIENKDSRQKTRFKDGLIQETVVATITWSYRSQLN